MSTRNAVVVAVVVGVAIIIFAPRVDDLPKSYIPADIARSRITSLALSSVTVATHDIGNETLSLGSTKIRLDRVKQSRPIA